jgi:hypothetical protein
MMTLEEFIERIPDFDTLSPAQKIVYFGYYKQETGKYDYFQGNDISDCFTSLNLNRYSNLSAYLSQKSKGKDNLFIKKGKGYVVEKKTFDEISKNIGNQKNTKPSNDLFSIEIFDNTRGYLINNAKQAIVCYDYGLFDACLVMIRKLVETLIIELFVFNNIDDKIKDNGHFLFLSGLIEKLLNEQTFSLSRNTKYGLPIIKKYGDLSAHNFHFNARKPDIDNFKLDLRIILEELIHLIDYPNRNS